jgi:hypothetical protein
MPLHIDEAAMSAPKLTALTSIAHWLPRTPHEARVGLPSALTENRAADMIATRHANSWLTTLARQSLMQRLCQA